MLVSKTYKKNVQKIDNEELFGNIFVGSPSLQKVAPAGKFYVAKELRTTLGVPDYVLLTDGDYKKLQDFALEYPDIKFSGKYAAVVSFIYKNKQTDIGSLSKFFSVSKYQASKSLENLEKWGVVTFQDDERQLVKIRASFVIPQLNSIAIELKLSSWEKALWQAVRNSSQFSSSYIIMPSYKLNLLKSKTELFVSNKVSTAVFDIDSLELTHITKAKNSMHFSSRYYIETFSSLISNITSFQEVKS